MYFLTYNYLHKIILNYLSYIRTQGLISVLIGRNTVIVFELHEDSEKENYKRKHTKNVYLLDKKMYIKEYYSLNSETTTCTLGQF